MQLSRKSDSLVSLLRKLSAEPAERTCISLSTCLKNQLLRLLTPIRLEVDGTEIYQLVLLLATLQIYFGQGLDLLFMSNCLILNPTYVSHRGTRPPRQLPLWAAFGPDVTLCLSYYAKTSMPVPQISGFLAKL